MFWNFIKQLLLCEKHLDITNAKIYQPYFALKHFRKWEHDVVSGAETMWLKHGNHTEEVKRTPNTTVLFIHVRMLKHANLMLTLIPM